MAQVHSSPSYIEVDRSPLDNETHVVLGRGVRPLVETLFAGSPNFGFASSRLKVFAKFDESEVQLGPLLGQGRFGQVHEVQKLCLSGRLTRRSSNLAIQTNVEEGRRFMAEHCHRSECGYCRYAVKSIPFDGLDEEHRSLSLCDLAIEAHFLASIEHPNIIKLRGLSSASLGNDGCFIVLDKLYETLGQRMVKWRRKLAKAKFVFNKLRGKQGQRQEWMMIERISLAADISSAVAYLHDNHIMHRDLKPDNIGFDIRGDIRLFDFGLAKEHTRPSKGPKLHTGCAGTRRYMAPENVRGVPYDMSVDVYSFALLLWQMVELKTPFAALTMGDFSKKVVYGGQRPKLKPSWNPDLANVVRQCWSDDPSQRLSAQNVQFVLNQILFVTATEAEGKEGVIQRRRSTFEQNRYTGTTLSV